MEFSREIYQSLLKWKRNKNRKPLLVMGSRQIGKTTSIQSFGRQEYQTQLYLNLERQSDLHEIFVKDKRPSSIIKELSLIHQADIIPNRTLVILDEIQACPDALTALKYFEEEKQDIHVVGAGSLLGLTIGSQGSFPVGKVDFLDMYPLSFSEYLMGTNSGLYKSYHYYLEEKKVQPISAVIYNQLLKVFKEYLLVGGMPEVAAHYQQTKDLSAIRTIQQNILRAYQLDFIKHADKTTATRVQHVWDTIPSQLAKENKKFLYRTIRSGARAREYESAIQWLDNAGIVYKISNIEKPGIPLKAYQDISTFKLYLFETGLLMKLAGLHPKTFISGDQFFTEFKGSLAENYVAQSLTKLYGHTPYYWTSQGKAEIDFVIDHRGHNIPIEVKSGKATKAKSLALYKKRYDPPIRVRISNLNLHLTDDLLNVPLFYADQIDKLIEMIL